MAGLLRWLHLSSTGSRAQGLSSCSSQVLQHRLDGCGTWDLPRSGVEPVSPASAGRFFTTEPPEKPLILPFLSSPPLGHSVFRNLSYEHPPPRPPYNAATKLQLLTLFSPDGKNYLPRCWEKWAAWDVLRTTGTPGVPSRGTLKVILPVFLRHCSPCNEGLPWREVRLKRDVVSFTGMRPGPSHDGSKGQ